MSGKSGLGRGLGSLIPQALEESSLLDTGERIEQLSVAKLVPNPEQPRTVFDDVSLQELAESIKRYGIVQPLVVSPHGGSYIIIAGERRWRAAQLAKLATVPAIVRTTKQIERLELALIENVQRVDLSPLEQAVSIARLHDQFNLGYGAIAKRLGKAETTLSNIVRLLQLPDEARKALAAGKISEGHARQILALKDAPDQQLELLRFITSQGWNVRQAERYVSSLKQGFRTKKAATARVALETPETARLSKRYGTPVKIHRMAKGGRLEIMFNSDQDLQRLLDELER
jgi:ParB family chromosome partitioning protein